jgi:hypothetical protein
VVVPRLITHWSCLRSITGALHLCTITAITRSGMSSVLTYSALFSSTAPRSGVNVRCFVPQPAIMEATSKRRQGNYGSVFRFPFRTCHLFTIGRMDQTPSRATHEGSLPWISWRAPAIYPECEDDCRGSVAQPFATACSTNAILIGFILQDNRRLASCISRAFLALGAAGGFFMPWYARCTRSKVSFNNLIGGLFS